MTRLYDIKVGNDVGAKFEKSRHDCTATHCVFLKTSVFVRGCDGERHKRRVPAGRGKPTEPARIAVSSTIDRRKLSSSRSGATRANQSYLETLECLIALI